MAWFHKAYRYGLLLGVVVSVPLGCGGGTSSESGNDTKAPSSGGKGESGADDDSSDDPEPVRKDAGAAKGDAPLPPEIEVGLSFEVPQAGKTSVYVPNPSTNRVAVVNASTFAIETLSVGGQPTYAATVPGQDVALVLNVATRDAALLRTEAGNTSVVEIEVGHDANAIGISPSGQHAVIYLNAAAGAAGARSYQDLTIVNLAPTLQGAQKRAQRVSVGFRPRAVQFSSDGKQAFVITEDGISILDFAAIDSGPTIARLVGLGDTLSDAQSVDVQVTPNGAYAIARRAGESTLRLITLADGKVESLSLAALLASERDAGVPPGTLDAGLSDAAVPEAGMSEGGASDASVPSGPQPELTDLDIAPDGSFAIAVLRDVGALVRIPLPGGFANPASVVVRKVVDQLIGSVTLSKSGALAVAYTTAVAEESVLLIDLTQDAAPRGIRLRKAVRAVALSDDGARVLVLHATVGAGTTPANEDARIDASEGYSLIDTSSGFVKLQLTSARIRERDLLITPDRAQLFALVRNDNAQVRVLDVVDLNSFQVTSSQLNQPPAALGFVPTVDTAQGRVFVGHASQGGMITFFDAKSGAKVQEVAGFEIASRIRQ